MRAGVGTKIPEEKNKKKIAPAVAGVGSREQNMDAAPGLPGKSPIPVLFQPKGA